MSLVRPFVRASLLRAFVRSLTGGGGGGPVIPVLTLSNVLGQYEIADMSTLFQDAAGTVPVTEAGQPVGRISDKSGAGNHATQTTSGDRAVLTTDGTYWWLQGDGINTFYSVPNIALSVGTTTVGMAVRRAGAVGIDGLFDASGGQIYLNVQNGTTGVRWGYDLFRTITNPTVVNDTDAVIVGTDIGDRPSLRVNGNQTDAGMAGNTGGANISGLLIHGSNEFSGRFYGAVFRNAVTNGAELDELETYLAALIPEAA